MERAKLHCVKCAKTLVSSQEGRGVFGGGYWTATTSHPSAHLLGPLAALNKNPTWDR
jgi:hypothetical protein